MNTVQRYWAIHNPTDQEEAARDLLRCREDIRVDLLRSRRRLSKFLLRHGRRFTEFGGDGQRREIVLGPSFLVLRS